MDIVVETDRIIVVFCVLTGQAIVLREHKIVGLAGIIWIIGLDEVVLDMALRADQ